MCGLAGLQCRRQAFLQHRSGAHKGPRTNRACNEHIFRPNDRMQLNLAGLAAFFNFFNTSSILAHTNLDHSNSGSARCIQMQCLISVMQDALTCPDLMGELKSALEAEASILIVAWLHGTYSTNQTGTSWRARTFPIQSFQDHFDLYNEVHHLLSCPDFKAELEKCEDLLLVTMFLFQSCICACECLVGNDLGVDRKTCSGLNSWGPGSGVQPCACCAFHLHDGGLSWDVDIRLNIFEITGTGFRHSCCTNRGDIRRYQAIPR